MSANSSKHDASSQPTERESGSATRKATRIAAIYLLVSLPYIVISDWLVENFLTEAWEVSFQSVKGMIFVGLSAALIHGLSRKALERSTEAEQRARGANERARALARHLTTTQEDERRKLSRDVHDQLGQFIAALRVTMVRLRRAEMSDTARQILAEIEEITEELSEETRRLARTLSPPVIDRRGLLPALGELVDELGKRCDVTIAIEAEPEVIELDPEQAVHLFRLCQEALGNVIRHAAADRAWLRLRAAEGELTVEIEDDGRGIGPDAGRGLGLTSMTERAELLGGSLVIEPRGPAGGARLRATLPRARTSTDRPTK